MTKLKDERASYLEYQKIVRELEHLNKLYTAYKFVSIEVGVMFVTVSLCSAAKSTHSKQPLVVSLNSDLGTLGKLRDH